MRTSAGAWSAQLLVVGAGGLSAPKLPEIDGIDTFQGELFHSARWDHDVDLTGKRVAVIGTGASAIQIVPELQKGRRATSTSTSAPRPGSSRATTGPTAGSSGPRCAGCPGLQRLYRTGLYWAHEAYVPAFTLQPKLAAPARKVALGNIRKGIKDPELRAKVTPNFDFGCKRVLRSNDYYPALDADNTDLVTDPIAKVTGNAIVTADGVEREIDVLVVATGFYTTELPDHRARDRPLGPDACRALAGDRHGGLQGHDHPRLPQPVHARRPQHRPGPHEHDLHHRVAGRLHARRDPDDEASERIASIEPTEADTDAWNRSLQKRMGRTVWTTGGCQSWYLDAHGRNTTLWPRSTVDFRRRLASFDADAYQEVPPEKVAR